MAHTKKRSHYDIMHPLYESIAESNLSAPQAHLLLTLYKFMDHNGSCRPSYNTLQRYTKMSRHTLCKHVKSLTDTGWINYEQGNKSQNKANTYQLNLAKVGLKIDSNIVPIDNAWYAPDGSAWSCQSEYYADKMGMN